MSNKQMPPRQPVLLIIMDGVGVNPSRRDNAVAMASTPNLDDIYATHERCLIEASGRAVGLPDGQMGNSEVGHLTIGAGTVLKQDLVKINDAIADGSFFDNEALRSAAERARDKDRPLHLAGLVSDGGVHSHIDHLLALVRLCADAGVRPMVHMLTDGRDTAPTSAGSYLDELEQALAEADGAIATVIGRYYGMDRDKRWERVEKAWQAIAKGEGRRAGSAAAAIEAARQNGENDEFITPTVLEAHVPFAAGDECVFFNFRNDRPRELCEALALKNFDAFERPDYTPVSLTTLTRYASRYDFPIAFTKDEATVTLGHTVSEHGIRQLRVAETEKYPHVTFFLNGGRDEPLDLEDRKMADSPKVATYDLKPEMSAEEVAETVEDGLRSGDYGLIVVNFANGDMVGHTGVPDAVVKAVETVDTMVGRLWSLAVEKGYSIVLTADHGNADMLVDPISGEPHTQHTVFPVACVVHDSETWQLGTGHGLPSLAPTILQLMGLPQPEDMHGESLLLASRNV